MSNTRTKTERVVEWLTFFGSVGLLVSICVGAAFLIMLRFRHNLGVCG